MCIFSRPVRHVSGTRILAADFPDGRQSIVYSMNIEASEELAMILPIPVAPNAGEDALQFVDLQNLGDLFEQIEVAFPPLMATQSLGIPRSGSAPARRTLTVHNVGAFEASYVPSPADFDRLDPRFRLPEVLLGEVPRYADYGFAVFQLKPTTQHRVHPMAFLFPRREPETLFFPAVHIHDGRCPREAEFDHTLYAQPRGLVARMLRWTASNGALGDYLDSEQAQPVLNYLSGARRTWLRGRLPNQDVVLAPPVGLDERNIQWTGQYHRVCLTASSAFNFGPPNTRFPGWVDTSRHRMNDVRASFEVPLQTLLQDNVSRWRLAPWDPNLPAFFMNGRQVWRGTDYMNGSWHKGTAPGRLMFSPFTTNVEPQKVELAFTEIPSESLAGEISEALTSLLF